MDDEDECMYFNRPFTSLKPLFVSLASHSSDMIHESNPITNTFISIPPDLGQLDCAAYLAGIVAGILDSAKFVSQSYIFSRLLSHSLFLYTACESDSPYGQSGTWLA